MSIQGNKALALIINIGLAFKQHRVWRQGQHCVPSPSGHVHNRADTLSCVALIKLPFPVCGFENATSR